MKTGTKWGWWFSGLLLFATLLNYMDRQALGQLATLLKSPDVINLDDARYGRLEKLFSWAFAFGSIVFGLLADRFGPRHLYPLALLGWSLSGCACGLANSEFVESLFGNPEESKGYGSYCWLLICRTSLGFFEAGHWPCALITLQIVLNDKDRPFGNSILQSGASLGAAITPYLISSLTKLGCSWPVIFACVGMVGIFWLPVWYQLASKADLSPPKKNPIKPDSISKGKLVIQIILLTGLVVSMGLTWQFFRAWLPKFLKENQHYPELFSEGTTDLVVTAYYIFADIGCIASGGLATYLAQKRGMRIDKARLVSFLGCTLCAGLAIFATRVPPGYLQVTILLLVGAGTLGLHPHYYAAVQDLPRTHTGLISGGLAASTWFIVGQMQEMIGKHIKATNDYTLGMTIAGLAPIVGLVCLIIFVFVPGIRTIDESNRSI